MSERGSTKEKREEGFPYLPCLIVVSREEFLVVQKVEGDVIWKHKPERHGRQDEGEIKTYTTWCDGGSGIHLYTEVMFFGVGMNLKEEEEKRNEKEFFVSL